MGLPFGHIWCCNRSLNDIQFENCEFDGICKPMKLKCPENEPLTLDLKNCTVIGRNGYEDIEFVEGENIKAINLENITFKNLNKIPRT